MRYDLVTILGFVVLAKLAGDDRLSTIAESVGTARRRWDRP